MCTAQSAVRLHAVESGSRKIVSDEMLLRECQRSIYTVCLQGCRAHAAPTVPVAVPARED